MPDPNVILIRSTRLSWPNLFTPKAIEEGKDPKFSCNLILDKRQHAAVIILIEAAIERAALTKFGKKVPISGKKKCLHDGEEDSVLEKEGYGPDVMYVRATSNRRPQVLELVDGTFCPLTAQDSIPYAGCYVHATIQIWAWEHKTGGRGVSAELRGVVFDKDGESFGAGPIDVENEFADLKKDVPGMDNPLF